MSQDTKKSGQRGEEIALKFLKKKGYHFLTKNFRIRNGEIDLIFLDPTKTLVVFVEVKTRRTIQFGTPLEAITTWKLAALVRTAEFYKHTHKNLPDRLRIDAVSVMLNEKNTVETIEHMENISG